MLELYIVRKMYNKSIFIEKELPYQITFEGCISADYNPRRFSSLLILKRHTRDIFSFNKFAVYGWPWPWPFQTTFISFRRRALYEIIFKFKILKIFGIFLNFSFLTKS